MSETKKWGQEILEGSIHGEPSKSTLSLDNEGIDSAIILLRQGKRLRVITVGELKDSLETFFHILMADSILYNVAFNAVTAGEIFKDCRTAGKGYLN